MQISILKTSILFIFFLYYSGITNAQAKWEQMEPTLKDSSEAATIRFYTAAAKDIFFSNRKLGEAFANKGYNLVSSNPTYKNEKGDLSNLLGIFIMYDGNYELADKYLKDALSISKEENNEALKIKALTNLALNSSKKGNYQQAILQILELIPLLEKKGDKTTLGNNYANLSNAYYYLNQIRNAEKYQLKALDLFTKASYKKGISNALNTLGTIYTDQKKFDVAISFCTKSLTLKQEANDSLGMANTYSNMADLYRKLNNRPAQLKVLQKAEKLYKALNDNEGIAKVYTNLGTYYYDVKDYTMAADYQNRAIKLSKSGKDQYILSAAYENIAKTYSYLNRPDSAITFNTKATGAKDSLMNLELQKRIAETEIRYETEKKEKLIGEQQLLLKEKEFAILRRNYLVAFTGASLLLVIAAGYFLSRQRSLKNKAQLQKVMIDQQHISTQAVIEAEERERIRIAKDLHDGVGQMMSVAKMNLSTMEEELNLDAANKLKMDRIIGLVDESCKEVRSVSHNLMPNALLKAGLMAAIREFIDKIDHRSLQIDIHSEGLDGRLNPDTETVLYRVIQESVNNVIKHSEANRLDISFINDTDGVSVTVEDNGKGFDTTNTSHFEGIGLKNMKTRIEYLRGTIEWNSTEGNGTLVAIHIPANGVAGYRQVV